MVTIRYDTINGITYVKLLHGNKFIRSLGRADKITNERILFEKRKEEKKLEER